jgi:hypothetical protein
MEWNEDKDDDHDHGDNIYCVLYIHRTETEEQHFSTGFFPFTVVAAPSESKIQLGLTKRGMLLWEFLPSNVFMSGCLTATTSPKL